MRRAACVGRRPRRYSPGRRKRKLPYYTVVTFALCIGLAVFAVLVYENDWFSRERKRGFLAAYAGISVAILAEWASIALNGTPEWLIPLHAVTKATDYIVSPWRA